METKEESNYEIKKKAVKYSLITSSSRERPIMEGDPETNAQDKCSESCIYISRRMDDVSG